VTPGSRHPALLRWVAAATLTTCLPCAQAQNTPAAPAAAATVVQQPRPFGYVLGDVLTQRILLQSQGHDFDPATLPPAERAGLWLARRESKIESGNDGRRWLIIDYQLINSPQTLMTVNLPALSLKPKAGTAELNVPEWPVSVSPLTPRQAFAKGGLQDLRGDHPAPEVPTTALWRQLELWSGACAITLLAWLLWWLARYVRAAANQPFAHALGEIRRTDDDSSQAWLALHRALDKTAGRALQLNSLPFLFQHAPHLEPRRAEIERFYIQSNERFFGAGAPPPARPSSTAISVRALCAALRRIEKRHER
jgi:mxaA protein